MWWNEDWAKAILLLTGLYLTWQFHYVLLLIFGGVILGVALAGVIDAVNRRITAPRWCSALIVLGGSALILTGLIWTAVPFLAQRYNQFVAALPGAIDQLERMVTNLGFGFPEEIFNPSTYQFFQLDSLAAAGSAISATVNALVNVIFILVLGIYFSLDPRTYRDILATAVPRDVLRKMTSAVRWWVASRVVSMATVGVLTTVGLILLGFPFPFVLGILAFILCFIPNLGPILAFIPAAIVSAVSDTGLLLSVFFLYVGVQVLESYFITPQIEKRTLSMPPGLNLSLQITLGTVFGFLGLLFAVPLALVGREWYRGVYKAS